MTHLFAALFFSGVLFIAISALVDLWQANRAVILAALPWTDTQIVPASALDEGQIVVTWRRQDRRGYWAMPSISSERPSLASTVSPATVR